MTKINPHLYIEPPVSVLVVNEGQDIVLTCRVNLGDRGPDLYKWDHSQGMFWERPPLAMPSVKSSPLRQEDGPFRSKLLVVENVKKRNSGAYICHYKWGTFILNKTIYVNVKGILCTNFLIFE